MRGIDSGSSQDTSSPGAGRPAPGAAADSGDSPLAQGIAAAKAGDKAAARQLLTEALRRHPDSEAAWLWLGAVLETPQARAFCLRHALVLNPDNQTVRRGLGALEKAPRAATIVARPASVPQPSRAPVPQAPLVRPRPLPSLAVLPGQRRFWRGLIACLGIIAIGLLGMLAYAMLGGSSQAGNDSLAAGLPSPSSAPRGTLRPTFTATPTITPTPTDTPTPAATATRPREPRPSPTAKPTTMPTAETLHPAPPARSLDPRLASLGVHVEPAPVAPGQPHWYLVEARWANEREAAGKHNIFVEVLDAQGGRAVGQMVIVQWPDGSVALPVEDPPPPDWAVDFPMYNTLGSYAVSVGGGPSDRLVGLGLGTAEDPHMKVHTSFYLVFRRVY